jgi:regulator of sigma E protease
LRLLRDSGGEFLLRICTLRSLSGWGGVIAYFYTTGVAGTASAQGWLSLVGVMLISQGIANLLPVPCLNGWKALEFLYELMMRRPVANLVSNWAAIFGLLVLVVLGLGRCLLLDVLWFIGLFRG